MTDFQKFSAVFCLVVGIILTAGFSYKLGDKLGYKRGYDTALNLPHESDTVMVRETLTVYEPQEVIKYKDKIIYIPVTDSVLVHVHDTTYIALQSEKKVYEDTDYRAVVSGIYPKLEEISVYPKTITITNTKTVRQHWGWAITAGPGIVWNGTFHAGVGVAAGISYNF